MVHILKNMIIYVPNFRITRDLAVDHLYINTLISIYIDRFIGIMVVSLG